MDFTGRPSRGMVFVDSPALASHRALAAWLTWARAFVATLPPKAQTESRVAPARAILGA
jgi:hypothetical protein